MINASATVTDPLGLAISDTLAIPEGSSSGISVVSRSLVNTRVIWGPIIDQGGILGPSVYAADGLPRIVSQFFKLQWDVQIVGGRFFKAPGLSGDIQFKLWHVIGVGPGTTGVELASTTVPGLVVDDGGYHEFVFTPTEGGEGETYAISYFSPSGIYPISSWVWHAMDWVNPPFEVPMFAENTQGRWNGTAWGDGTLGHRYPDAHTAANYYIDVDVEWEVNTPRYQSGREYFDQFINGPRYT